METQQERKLSFANVDIIHKQGKFGITVYQIPTLSGAYSNFEIFLPSVYKFGMVYILVYRCFSTSSNYTQFHVELAFAKAIFGKNGHPENFIDKCCKTFLNNIHPVRKMRQKWKKAFPSSPSICNIFENLKKP